jgi:hypothetical protein
MMFDVRIPMGMLFTLTGTILGAFGLATRGNLTMYEKSLGIDVNLWWGAVLLVFGVVVLALGRRGQAQVERAAKAKK